MSKQFFEHLNKYVEINENDFKKIITFFDLQNLKKKENILEAGTKCNQNYFVIEGCLQMFFVDSKGTERTIQFAIENWWMTDFLAFQNQTASEFYIQAVEHTQILSISSEKQEQVLTMYPKLEKYFRILAQVAYGSSLMKAKYMYDLSKEEIYFYFTKQFPEFSQRVPQYLVASYLGVTPEYVSEIRKKKRS